MLNKVIRSVAVFLLALVLSGCGGERVTKVRIRNASDKDFGDVTVYDHNFGNIKSGAVTDYQVFLMAYPDPYINLTSGTNRLKLEPAKYQGEQSLGQGQFTYVVDVKDQQITVRAEKDQ